MLKIGLTGGIGSGKTVVGDRLGALGATIVDADALAHQITAPGGAAMPAIASTFGAAFVAADGSLNRQAMRERVFSDPSSRAQLEAITHPLIRQISEAAVSAATGAYLVLVIPLLVESGEAGRRADRILVVDCSEATQIERVMQRNGFTRERVATILAAQASRAQRLAAATDVLVNEGKTLPALLEEVDALHRKYLEIAEKQFGRA
ncbi:MAG: dephospho-CoA kinase [Janthinobacterium lividum]